MSSLLNGMKILVQRYPVMRGMLSYSLLLPASNTTQQLLDPKRKKYDPWETFNFTVYGSFLLAPSLYCWIRLANIVVKANSLKGALIKAYIEQFTWAPFAYVQFYVCINLMERKSWEECLHQCRTKIPDTWKVGFCIWPVVQTVNFWIVPMKNRVSFVAFFSYLWNTFLSFMHHRDLRKK